ncbi:MAG: anion transporter [Rhodocyclaceae bacterium]|nr:anion transporter [Rhodocyclaceae bacterium]MBX3670558.1 anion transporter [Rhodocyclaceae bacterium]
MTTLTIAIFCVVYAGMILGGLPFLQLDRTGVALLGAIALISVDAMSVEQAAAAVHLPTLVLFFSFMVLSAQMRLGGVYTWVARRVAALPLTPPQLLGALILLVGLLAAVFSNDIVCMAVAPVLLDSCRRRGLDAVPFLLALACAANIGSALTLIGNPQNMLIGQTLGLPFGGYVREALLPVALGLAAAWILIALQQRGRWSAANTAAPAAAEPHVPEIKLDPWQAAKGLAVTLALLLAFLYAPWPREHVALTAAGVLLMSRKFHSTQMLGLVDWELLVLFVGLFVVNAAFQQTGTSAHIVAALAAAGFDLHQPGALFLASFGLSNVVSNVPAVMLLLPVATHALAGPVLALVSTLAGNLFIVGSIANMIVVDAAARRGVRLDWRRHARTGVPVTLASLSICAVWLWLRLTPA